MRTVNRSIGNQSPPQQRSPPPRSLALHQG
jgi:hypothetical protein